MFKKNLILILIVLISILTIIQCTENIKQFDDKEISGDEEFIIDEADENNIIKINNAEQSGDNDNFINKDPNNVYRPLQIIEPKLLKTKKVEKDNAKDMKKLRKNPPFPILRTNDEQQGVNRDDDDDDRNNPFFIHHNKMIPIIP